MYPGFSDINLAPFYLSHARRTRQLMAQLLQALQKAGKLEDHTPELKRWLLNAAFHHDLGKLAVPEHLLLKPGKLTIEEFEMVKSHTWLGEKLAEPCLHSSPEELAIVKGVCRSHHEKWDGTGYPDGLAGTSIPYPARLMAVVDVYDALTHERPYKAAYDPYQAKCILDSGTGTQFDPVVVQTFLQCVPSEKAYGDHIARQTASTL